MLGISNQDLEQNILEKFVGEPQTHSTLGEKMAENITQPCGNQIQENIYAFRWDLTKKKRLIL